jgi:hypothetical protein
MELYAQGFFKFRPTVANPNYPFKNLKYCISQGVVTYHDSWTSTAGFGNFKKYLSNGYYLGIDNNSPKTFSVSFIEKVDRKIDDGDAKKGNVIMPCPTTQDYSYQQAIDNKTNCDWGFYKLFKLDGMPI